MYAAQPGFIPRLNSTQKGRKEKTEYDLDIPIMCSNTQTKMEFPNLYINFSGWLTDYMLFALRQLMMVNKELIYYRIQCFCCKYKGMQQKY